jgi:hypothetical protein
VSLGVGNLCSKWVGTIAAGFNIYSPNYCCELQQSDSKYYRKSGNFEVQKKVLNGLGAEERTKL